jgi:hypothetical protein
MSDAIKPEQLSIDMYSNSTVKKSMSRREILKNIAKLLSSAMAPSVIGTGMLIQPNAAMADSNAIIDRNSDYGDYIDAVLKMRGMIASNAYWTYIAVNYSKSNTGEVSGVVLIKNDWRTVKAYTVSATETINTYGQKDLDITKPISVTAGSGYRYNSNIDEFRRQLQATSSLVPASWNTEWTALRDEMYLGNHVYRAQVTVFGGWAFGGMSVTYLIKKYYSDPDIESGLRNFLPGGVAYRTYKVFSGYYAGQWQSWCVKSLTGETGLPREVGSMNNDFNGGVGVGYAMAAAVSTGFGATAYGLADGFTNYDTAANQDTTSERDRTEKLISEVVLFLLFVGTGGLGAVAFLRCFSIGRVEQALISLMTTSAVQAVAGTVVSLFPQSWGENVTLYE